MHWQVAFSLRTGTGMVRKGWSITDIKLTSETGSCVLAHEFEVLVSLETFTVIMGVEI